MKKHDPQLDHFDNIVVNRLFAPDFAQPAHEPTDFYREKAIEQSQCAISNIAQAHSQTDLIVAIAQANAFIDSAYHLEFINLLEKIDWVGKVADAHTDAVLEA